MFDHAIYVFTHSIFGPKLAPLVKLLGKQKYNEGFTAIFELLQHEQLNKQVSVETSRKISYGFLPYPFFTRL